MTWQQDNGGTEKLLRWIRCLFSLALSETDIAMQLLDQAVSIAEDARKVHDLTLSKESADDLTQILLVALAAVQVVSTRGTRMACNNSL